MPRPVTMPIANDKRRRPERTEAIRILKPVMSNIPKRVSATVAAHANDTVNELGKRDITAPVYSTKWAKSPQDTFFAPCDPHKPKRSATADRKEAPSANRANKRTICVPYSVSCAVFELIQDLYKRNATRRVSQLSAILLHQEQAGEIAKTQLLCVRMSPPRLKREPWHALSQLGGCSWTIIAVTRSGCMTANEITTQARSAYIFQRSYRIFAISLISINCVGSASRG